MNKKLKSNNNHTKEFTKANTAKKDGIDFTPRTCFSGKGSRQPINIFWKSANVTANQWEYTTEILETLSTFLLKRGREIRQIPFLCFRR